MLSGAAKNDRSYAEAYWIPDPKPSPDYETYLQMCLGAQASPGSPPRRRLVPEHRFGASRGSEGVKAKEAGRRETWIEVPRKELCGTSESAGPDRCALKESQFSWFSLPFFEFTLWNRWACLHVWLAITRTVRGLD